MICLICKKEFKDITNTHLKFHGLTRKEYKLIDKDFKDFLSKRMSEIAKGKIDVKRGKKYEDVVGEQRANEWKKKIGLKSIGNKNCLGKPAWNKNTKGICKKNSTSYKKGDKRIIGKNNPNWNNGSSFEPYGLEFNRDLKEVIRNRDRRKCCICGKTELENKKKLAIHHIDYNKKNNDPKNLISLCNRCHMKTNHNRKYWKDYFKRIVK